MKVLDPGHKYRLNILDSVDALDDETLTFVKRVGYKYPGNITAYPGTTSQEVLRALIDRVKYLHAQLPCWHNHVILYALRLSIYMFELRNAQIKGLRWPSLFKSNQEQGADGHYR